MKNEPDPRLQHDFTRRLDVLRQQLADLHKEVVEASGEASKLIKNNKLDKADLCDAGFLFREMKDLLHDCKKETNNCQDLAGRVLAARVTQESMQDSTVTDFIKGNISTANADVKMEAQIPDPDSHEYLALMEELGVPKELRGTRLIRLDWNKFTEYLTQRHSEGKPKLKGLGKEWPRYLCVFRKKN